MATVVRERHSDGGSMLDVDTLLISSINDNWFKKKLDDLIDLFSMVN